MNKIQTLLKHLQLIDTLQLNKLNSQNKCRSLYFAFKNKPSKMLLGRFLYNNKKKRHHCEFGIQRT